MAAGGDGGGHPMACVAADELAGINRRQLRALQQRVRAGEHPSQETLEMAILGIALADDDADDAGGNDDATTASPNAASSRAAASVVCTARAPPPPCHVTPVDFEKAKRRMRRQLTAVGIKANTTNLRPVLGAAALVVAAAARFASRPVTSPPRSPLTDGVRSGGGDGGGAAGEPAISDAPTSPDRTPGQPRPDSVNTMKDILSSPSDAGMNLGVDLIVSCDDEDGQPVRLASSAVSPHKQDGGGDGGGGDVQPPATSTGATIPAATPHRHPPAPPALSASGVYQEDHDSYADSRRRSPPPASGLHETDKAKLKMIVSAYAVREEGLAGKTLAATAEARRYLALLKKQETESASRRKKQEKMLDESRETQAALRDEIHTLTTKLHTLRESYENKIADDEATFKNDLERIEGIYRNQMDTLIREHQKEAANNDHLKVRSQEELIEAGRRQERERCERMIKASHESKKRAAGERETYHQHALDSERKEKEEVKADFAKLKKSSVEEVKALRKQVEYLFEYARNLTRILAVAGSKDHKGASLSSLSRKKLRKPLNAPVGVDPLDLSLLQHIQTCWYKTTQYLVETRGVHVEQEPTLLNFPLMFVSSSDFCDATAPRGAWTRRTPSKDAVDALIRNLEASRLGPLEPTPAASPDSPVLPTSLQAAAMAHLPLPGSRPVSAARTRPTPAATPVPPEDPGTDEYDALARQCERYRVQYQAELQKNKDMRLAMESQARVLARLKVQQATPSRPQSAMERPGSALAGKRRPMSAAGHRRATPTDLATTV